jgi:hypothetical protein
LLVSDFEIFDAQLAEDFHLVLFLNKVVHVQTNSLDVYVVLSERREGQRRLEFFSQAVFMFDVLIE